MFETSLTCRNCGKASEIGPYYVCSACFGPLEVAYNYDAIRANVVRDDVTRGPETLWRYRYLLPTQREPLGLEAGWTPLVRADRLGRALGLNDLWVKNDSLNPTFSFKDRNVAVATNAALELGIDTFACASTGNLAGSVAGFAARAGLRSFVIVPSDLEQAKLLAASIYGATLVTVDGNYDAVNRLCTQIADEYGWGFANINLRPFYSEGSKTMVFEIVEQFGWDAPDAIVIPMAGASLLTKTGKGLQELKKLGWLEEANTRLIGVQAEGCAPVVRAFEADETDVVPVVPRTIAKSLAIGAPADGYYALQAIRESGGTAAAATDEEIVAGIELLATTEGILTETAGGTVVAAAKKLSARGALRPDERIVLAITGCGLKTLDAIAGIRFPMLHLSRANLGEFDAAMESAEVLVEVPA